MSPDALAIIGILFFLLAIVILVAGLMAFVSGSSRRARREEYTPPPPPQPPRPFDSGAGQGGIRFGPVQDLHQPQVDEMEADVYGGGNIVWGREGLEPARAAEAAWSQPYRGGAPEQEKCPVCRHHFADTGANPIIRCASCRTLVHQECMQLTNDCPMCHGTRFVAYS